MRKVLLATTAIIGVLAAQPAEAGPIATVVALLAQPGVSFGAAMTAVFGSVGTALIQLGLSVMVSAAAAALAGKPKQEVQRAELTRPTALPAYRYVYGTGWAPGTPVAWTVVGQSLYICWLVNSRPSALTSHTVLLDKRGVVASGDPFNFAGPGAVGSNGVFDQHVRYWIGRGDQTTCPDLVVSGSGGYFQSSDAWQGRTVVWAGLHCGDNGQMRERWPSTPPEMNVEGDWSLIWDPRDDSYSASNNQALVVLDALMRNPIRPYDAGYLRIDTFGWAADVADQRIPVKAGGTIPRYRADGVLVWSDGSELEDQISPLLAAGASRLVRIGGQLGIVPAVARPAAHTIRDMTDGQPIEMTRWQPSDEIYSEAVASYSAPDRAYEMAEAPVHIVPGAVVEDGGLPRRLDVSLDFVNDHRQAQRLSKIAVMRKRMQRTVSGELFPDAFVLVAGSVAALDLPAPYVRWNGLYDVEQISPAAGINDDNSITLRLPALLRETSDAIYAWDAATEEQDVEGAVLDPWVAGIQPPASISLSSGGDVALIAGNTVTVRVQVDWTVSPSESALSYEWQYKSRAVDGGTGGGTGDGWSNWFAGGTADSSATLRGWIVVGDHNKVGNSWPSYRARVRSVGIYGASDWIESGILAASGPTRILTVPAILMAVGGIGLVDLTLRQANDGNVALLELVASGINDVGTASPVATIPAGANVTVAQAESGLGSSVTRYYWLRARDGLGNASAWSAVASATTT